MELRYNSNGLTLPEELFELWNHFKKVKFGFSLDSVDKMNHYIRYPSDWNTVIKNLKRLDETPENIEVTIACAVQALNVYYVPDFIKWKLSMNFKKINAWPVGAGLVNSHFVYHPAHLNVKALPLWFKDEVKEKFENFYEWLKKENKNNPEFNKHPYGIERLKAMVDFVYSEDWSSLMPAFKEYIIKMDKIRGTDFSKTFPEMKELIK
jgi:MoaA/NifB/PqqE/SkfB family radical SAM enzyme